MKARISNLHKTEANWQSFINKCEIQGKPFIPEAGEIIIYDPDSNYQYARIKIGDGIQPLQTLPFSIETAAISLMKKQHYFETLDGGRITEYVDK